MLNNLIFFYYHVPYFLAYWLTGLTHALDVSTKTHGADHELTWTIQLVLCRHMRLIGDYEGAEILTRQQLEIYRNKFGDRHPQTASACCEAIQTDSRPVVAQRLRVSAVASALQLSL